MKIKKFNNLWTMGLVLFGVILIACYITKIFFPQLVIGVAEIPSIVNFGNYVDSHKWAVALFNGVTSFLSLYLYSCACCRVKLLSFVECCFLIVLIVISQLITEFLPTQAFMFNNILYLLIPLIVAIKRKINNFKVFYSTAICFIITSIAQSISLDIRGIITLISYPNTATYFVLLIDLYIWSTLLYLYFNYKGENKNG